MLVVGSVAIQYRKDGHVGLIFDPQCFDSDNRMVMSCEQVRSFAAALLDAAVAADQELEAEKS